MWLLDNRVQSPSGSDMLLKIELLWQNFPQLNKKIHGKLSPYFTELQKTVGKLGSSVENPNVVFYRQEQVMTF
jgi:uncharacterized circularly permuted ATP-grasp superfamily protein